MSNKKTKISIIIPCFNEEKNIVILYKELKSTIDDNYEIIFVDDKSTDNTTKIIEKICLNDKKVKLVQLRLNSGQSTAIAAGIDNSEGDIIVTMDSDLQHDPKDIKPMVSKINEGFDVVCGWRKYRGNSDSIVKKTIPSRISNFLIRLLTGVKLNDSTGGMRAFSRDVVENVKLYGEMHRYVPILATWKGFRITEYPINIRKRKYGKTKYNFTRILRGFLDLITVKFLISYSKRPIQIFGKMGLGTFFLGFIIGLYMIYDKIVNNVGIIVHHEPLLMLSALLIILGMNFLSFGVVADMISYEAIKKEKPYLIERKINY